MNEILKIIAFIVSVHNWKILKYTKFHHKYATAKYMVLINTLLIFFAAYLWLNYFLKNYSTPSYRYYYVYLYFAELFTLRKKICFL